MPINNPGGSGASDPWTYETWSGDLPTGIANGVLITHDAVPIDADDDIQWEIRQTAAYPSSIEFNYATGLTDTYWAIPNLNTSSRTWIRDTDTTGHFSGAKDAAVVPCVDMKVGDTIYGIVSIVGDGTGIGSVEIEGGTIEADSAIDWIRGVSYEGGQIGISRAGSGNTPEGFWYYASTTAANVLSVQEASVASDITTDSVYFNIGGASAAKGAFSDDGGTTWKYYTDGVGWQTMTLSEFATKGCVSTSNNFYDSTGYVPLDATIYNGLNITDPQDFRVAVAFYASATATDNVYCTNLTFTWDENDVVRQFPFSQAYQLQDVDAYRVSTTQILLVNNGFSTLEGISFVVRTK